MQITCTNMTSSSSGNLETLPSPRTSFHSQKSTLDKDMVRVYRYCHQIFKFLLPQSESTGSSQGKQVLGMKVFQAFCNSVQKHIAKIEVQALIL